MTKTRKFLKHSQIGTPVSSLMIKKQNKKAKLATPLNSFWGVRQRIGNQALSKFIQAKLTIGQPADVYEQEADRVADEVMRAPNPVNTELEEEKSIQRQVESGEEEEDSIQRQTEPEEEEEEESVQAKTAANHPPSVTLAIQKQIKALKGNGKPLTKSDRAFFEPRFGADFNQVLVHSDTKAAETARAVNARAFTVGRDIVFGVGQYSPETSAGKKILAHELTHVIQQGSTYNKPQGTSGNHIVSRSLFQTLSSPIVQRLTDPLSDMSTFQSPGASGWRGAIWGCYRNSCSRKHTGWDIHASTGTECKATVAGSTTHASQGSAGYGDYVILTSSSNATKKYIYAHLSARETAGTVAEGAKIGETGVTGNASSTRPHLHFTVKEGGSKVDPDGKGFTKPSKVIEQTGSTATTINYSDPQPCTPCSM